MEPDLRIPLRGLVYREGSYWIAHCLELDIVGQGEGPDEAIRQMVELVVAQVEDALSRNDIDSIFTPAPANLWALYTRAKDHVDDLEIPEFIDRIDVRELQFC